MPFEKGNKLGGRRKEKPFRDALMMELKSAGQDMPQLRSIAKGLIERAQKDNAACKEIIDRLDGKVPQAVIGDNDEDPISVTQTDSRDLARAVLDLLRCAEIEGGEENGQDSIET